MRFALPVLLLIGSAAGCKRTEGPRNAPELLAFVRLDPYRARAADSLQHLQPLLDTVLMHDQLYRQGGDRGMEKQAFFVRHSTEQARLDSIDIRIVSGILEHYGWLGPKDIGVTESQALFIVIQHADSSTQEKYLPMMREAARTKRLSASSLALLEDRIGLRDSGYQLYGTQLIYNARTKHMAILPIRNPEHLAETRVAAGLTMPGYQLYLSAFGPSWDLQRYYRELPEARRLWERRKQQAIEKKLRR